jgi:hypothetical protein
MIYDDDRHDEAVQDMLAASAEDTDRTYPGERLDAGFASVMDRLDRLDPAEVEAIDLAVTRAELGYQAYALGTEYLDRGDLDRASHWLRTAVALGVDDAAGRLHDVDELQRMVQAITPAPDELTSASECPGPALRLADLATPSPGSWVADVRVADTIIQNARAEADRIMAEARRRADEIMANANANATGEPAPSRRGARGTLHVPVLGEDPAPSVLLVCGPPGTGKSTLLTQISRLIHDLPDGPNGSDLLFRDDGDRIWEVQVKCSQRRVPAPPVKVWRLLDACDHWSRRDHREWIPRPPAVACGVDGWRELRNAIGAEGIGAVCEALRGNSCDTTWITTDPELWMRFLDWSRHTRSRGLAAAAHHLLVTPPLPLTPDAGASTPQVLTVPSILARA